jgi:hypothetical protein
MPMSLGAREDLKLDLAVEGLRCCGSVALKAWGTSMLPSLWPCDLLTIQKLASEEFIPGDIVLVRRNERVFIHRLIEKQRGLHGDSWITKGDAVSHTDPPAMELLGRVVEVRRGNRSFAPGRRISRIQSAIAWLLCRSDRLRNLVLSIHAARMQAGSIRAEGFVRRLFGTIYAALGVCLSRTLPG